jgi:hypothetical protein
MLYQFLHHLTQATLPVVIYDGKLIAQLRDYEAAGLLVMVMSGSNPWTETPSQRNAKVLKVTAAGRRAVRQHLRTMNAAAAYSTGAVLQFSIS